MLLATYCELFYTCKCMLLANYCELFTVMMFTVMINL
jgi:hypothetical protein